MSVTIGRMSVATASPTVPVTAVPSARRRTVIGVLTMLASGAGNQVGAGLGAHAFPAVGPAGVVAVRQVVAAAVLLPLGRPRLRSFTWAQWWPTLLLAIVFATMNLTLYVAVDRIGLGLAVTLEFLGPLAVALGTSRSRVDVLCALLAAGGVAVLIAPGPTTDYIGVALALVAAGCWASYILLNRLLGIRLPGLQGPAVATTIAAGLYLPVLVVLATQGRFTGPALGYAACAGLLCSAVPYAADLFVLRRVPAQFFGVFMSVNPVLAAVAGIVVLSEVLGLREWTGIVIVAAANAIAMSANAKAPPRPRRPGDEIHALADGVRVRRSP
jgi:inner membrane transporter RhtA